MGTGKMEISEPISIVRETRPEPVRKNLLSENKESLLFEKNKKNTYTRVSTIYIYIYIYIHLFFHEHRFLYRYCTFGRCTLLPLFSSPFSLFFSLLILLTSSHSFA